jgi:DNA-binding NarL/FixJ family response regulator
VKKPRILLAEDHTLVAEGIIKLLEPEFEFIGRVENGRELVDAVQRLHPDLVVVDISMPILNGVEAARQINKIRPPVKMLFLSMHADASYVSEAFRAGASGYVLKRSAASELSTAIHEVLQGKVYVTPLISKDFVQARDMGKDILTGRQREVLQLVAEGRSAKEIGAILHISVKTAEFHKAGIMEKLHLRSTAELTRYAIEHGIVNATSD